MGAEDNFWGVIDLVTMTAWDFKADEKGMTYPEPMDAIPAEFADEAELRRQELLEAAADCDDDLMEKVLMEEEVTVEELKAAIRKGTIACKIHPVFVGSSYKNKGVQELLDARGRLHAVPDRHSRHQGHEPRHRRGRRASLPT